MIVLTVKNTDLSRFIKDIGIKVIKEITVSLANNLGKIPLVGPILF